MGLLKELAGTVLDRYRKGGRGSILPLLAVLGCIAVAALHLWKKQTLLSIAGGTIAYMLLVQLVFV